MNRGLRITLCLLAAALLAGCATTTPVAPAATAVPAVLSTAAPTLATLPPTVTAAPAATALPVNKATEAPAAPAATTAFKDSSISLTWYGQSTFVLSAGSGLKALLDPTNASTGYKIPTLDNIDLVTVSHEHGDHNNVALASGSPQVLRGLAGSDWAKIDQSVKGVRVRTVSAFHDESQGGARGKNAIFIFEIGGLRVAHLGDLGSSLSPEQVKEIGPLDVLLIPVGGYYTIDAKAAVAVIGQLNPRVVVPMHYKTAASAASLSVLAPVDDFVKALGDQAVVSPSAQTITLDKNNLPAKLTVMVMKYQP